MRRAASIFLCVLVSASCGKNNDDNNANNTAPNNTTANNTTVNNTTVYNTTVNNTTVNNTTVNNTTVNNTTVNNTTPPYVPMEFMCDDVTPTGTLAELVGTWRFTYACIGSDPYEMVYALCAGAIASRVDIVGVGGFTRVNPDFTFVTSGRLEAQADLWLPDQCVAQIGSGDCASTETLLLGLAEQAGAVGTVSCVDDAAGGCFCMLQGETTARATGLLTSSGDGLMTLNEFDDAGAAEAFEWRFDATSGRLQSITSGSSWTYDADLQNEGTACDVYCSGFLANCNDVDGVTPYADYADCATQCESFPVAGSEQMTGDSLECRTYHLFASVDPSDLGNRGTHCPHAQAAATAPCQ